jgi:uncharacterized membrane protein YqgA involved in biofilm formation
MLDGPGRLGLAVLAAAALGLVFFLRARAVPRDMVLSVYALVVAVLGIYAILGPQAAMVGGAVLVLVFVVGAVIYGVLALVAHWADR